MGANSVGAELAVGRNQYHSVDVCRKFRDVPVAVDVVVCLTSLSMYCLLPSLNNFKETKVQAGQSFTILEGIIGNGTGLMFSTLTQSTGKFYHVIRRNFPDNHAGIFGRMVSAKSRECFPIKKGHLREVFLNLRTFPKFLEAPLTNSSQPLRSQSDSIGL